MLITFHFNTQPRHFRRNNLHSAYIFIPYKTPTDVCFKLHFKTLQDCNSASERIQILPLSMHMNNLISLCEGYSRKKYVCTKLGRTMFHLARVSAMAEQIPSSQTNNPQGQGTPYEC